LKLFWDNVSSYLRLASSSAYWCPNCWGTNFPYELPTRRTGHCTYHGRIVFNIRLFWMMQTHLSSSMMKSLGPRTFTSLTTAVSLAPCGPRARAIWPRLSGSRPGTSNSGMPWNGIELMVTIRFYMFLGWYHYWRRRKLLGNNYNTNTSWLSAII
jgi:hypothetical protein